MKGQMTMQGIINILILVMLLGALSGIFYTFIGNLNGNATAAGDTTTPAISGLIFPSLVIVCLLSIYVYISGNRQQQQYQE